MEMPTIVEGMPKALFTNVIVDVSHAIVKEITTEAGIVLQASLTERVPTTGVVVSVGADCKVLEVGNEICLPLNSGQMRFLDWPDKPKDVKLAVMDEKVVPAAF